MDDTTPGDDRETEDQETTEDLIEGTRQAKEAAKVVADEAEEDAEELQADLDQRAEDQKG